jgi:DNA-binding transcriptional MocR family regulator
MSIYQDRSTAELEVEQQKLEQSYASFQARGLKLNMARGKPSPAQLDLAMPLLSILPDNETPVDQNGEDTRNYGLLSGIPEARALMAEYLGVSPQNVIAAGSSSLNLMYDAVARAMSFGLRGNIPMHQQQLNLQLMSPEQKLRFLCPVPGYDRHFAITALFGFENIPIMLNEDGPDMDEVERLVNNDPNVKGIWCVPKYSNPTGTSYSDQVVRRFAALKPAAPDFRIYLDNAYAVHDLYPDTPDTDQLLNLKEACDEAGNPDIWYMFASTAKISFAGAGISALASSEANLTEIEAQMGIQTIGHDKVNQLRHVRWLESIAGQTGNGMAGIRAHMKHLAALLAPKFEAVDQILSRDLSGLNIAMWRKPKGGYFISLEVLPGTAKRTVELCKQAGVTLTEAGATWPGGNDPNDSNIRIAPSYPSLDELELASELLSICVRLAALEKLIAERS